MSATTKLYPPVLQDQLKAGYDNNIIINFKHNRAVALPTDPNQSLWLQLKVRTIPNNKDPLVGYYYTDVRREIGEATIKNGQTTFSLQDDSFANYLNVGQYYKVQISYLIRERVGEDEYTTIRDGYVSNVGIMKYTNEPTLSIDLPQNSSVPFPYNVVGRYEQVPTDYGEGVVTPADYSEKVNAYRFEIIRMSSGYPRIYDSGYILHDSSTDDNDYSSFDIFNFYKVIDSNINYRIRYSVITTNGIEKSVDSETITSVLPTEQDLGDSFSALLDYDNAYVDIVRPVVESEHRLLVREKTEGGVTIKEVVYTFSPNETTFRDFTVEQGISYKYYLYWMKDGDWYSSRGYQVNADFEDMFLTDGGGRQLKVRFNPTINTIHETILEAKTDTIGGKYPFFSRNQSVRYRDFQIGGLISLQMDEQHLFSDLYSLPEQPSRERTQTAADEDNQYLEELRELGYTSSLTDYTAPNYYRERKFREEVLAWLNDGQFKLFRSSSEGILLVRLMSVNMTPYNGTSRLVYSFTAQAYEAMPHDIPDLVRFGLLKIESEEEGE